MMKGNSLNPPTQVKTLANAMAGLLASDALSAAPLPSAAVLRGQKSVAIEHQGVIYRLQVTKLGKLILTK